MSHLKNTLSGTNTPPENALCVWGIHTWKSAYKSIFMLGYLIHDENAKTWVVEHPSGKKHSLDKFDAFQEVTPGVSFVMMKTVQTA